MLPVRSRLSRLIVNKSNLRKCLASSSSSKSGKDAPTCTKVAKFETCQIDPCSLDPSLQQPSVVIIGAGMAGLSAASRLAKCGLKNFTILEALDRPGGRIHSCWLGDSIAELGATYIEGGCVTNPAFTLAAQEGLIQHPLQRLDPSKGLFCASNGRAIDVPVSVAAYESFRHIEQQAASVFSLGCGRTHGDLQTFLEFRIQQELLRYPEEQRYDAARTLCGLTNALRCKCGDDLTQVSTDQFGSYIDMPGGNIRIPLGFVGILAPLLRDLPNGALKYNKAVSNVRWGTVNQKCPRAIVKCCDGEEHAADYVIVTVPLGVLKHQHEQLFCPALPAFKVEAIDKLGYGCVDKIFLEYEKPFWIWHEGTLRLAWSAEELADRRDWLKGISIIEEIPGSQHTLCAWICGKEASEMELQSDEEVIDALTRLLRQFTGDQTLPFPKKMLRSKWYLDPYFTGSYSYLAIGSTVNHQCDLVQPLPGPCEPVAPILLFAGEATMPGHYSTVHGARLSGIREADRILQLTDRFKGPPKD